MPEANLIHQRPAEMKQALEFTARRTGFRQQIIEKDYWCSLILKHLFQQDCPLVFKGGTLLSKAFTGFNRLSEDLDFTCLDSGNLTRSGRSRKAKCVKGLLDQLVLALGLSWKEEWTGHNNSMQYAGRIKYPSVLGARESVLIEVGIREPVFEAVTDTSLGTLLLDPLHQEPVLASFTAKTLTLNEAYAEKLRAALTRQQPAIRDLYDIWIANRLNVFPARDAVWLEMIRRKCEGLDLNKALTSSRIQEFEAGVETDLVPMLRRDVLDDFSFNQAIELLQNILDRVQGA